MPAGVAAAGDGAAWDDAAWDDAAAAGHDAAWAGAARSAGASVAAMTDVAGSVGTHPIECATRGPIECATRRGAQTLSAPVSVAARWAFEPDVVPESAASGHTQSATSGMSTPWSRVYWRAARRASPICWRSAAYRLPRRGTRSITSITRW